MSDVIKFTCWKCHGEFETTPETRQQALQEKEQNWGDLPLDECGTLCHECYLDFEAWLNTAGGHA